MSTGGSKPAPSNPPADKSWPVRVVIDGQTVELDRTLAAHLTELPDLTARKATKGWQMFCMYPAPGYQGGQFQIIWRRTVK